MPYQISYYAEFTSIKSNWRIAVWCTTTSNAMNILTAAGDRLGYSWAQKYTVFFFHPGAGHQHHSDLVHCCLFVDKYELSSKLTEGRIYPGAVLHWGRGSKSLAWLVPRFTCCPQIQKLADRSDVIFEVPNAQKSNFLGIRELTALPRPPNWWGGGSLHPCQEPHRRSRPFGPRFYGSQGLTHYRVGNPTNDKF